MLMQIPGWWQRHHVQGCYLFMSRGGGGVQSYLYANRVGFFVGKLELLLVPALPYLLLRAPVEERYRAHSLLNLTDLQLGPIHASLLAHQFSDALSLFFLIQVSRDRLLVCLATEHPTLSWASAVAEWDSHNPTLLLLGRIGGSLRVSEGVEFS